MVSKLKLPKHLADTPPNRIIDFGNLDDRMKRTIDDFAQMGDTYLEVACRLVDNGYLIALPKAKWYHYPAKWLGLNGLIRYIIFP